MNISKQILLFVFVFIWASSFSQCFKNSNTFQAREKLSMEISYNWGFIWVDAGEVYFKVDTAKFRGKECYKFTSYGRTYDSWDWFYKVRDLYSSFIDKESLKSLYFYRKVFEGGNVIYNKYIFDYPANKIYAYLYNIELGERSDTTNIVDCLYDPLTAIYFARNIDFTNAKIDQKFPIKIILDNEICDIYIRYLGHETIKDRDKVKHDCIKFKAKMVEGVIFKGGEDVTVWVTNDKNKIPVLVEAKILVGSIKAYMTKSEGLKY